MRKNTYVESITSPIDAIYVKPEEHQLHILTFNKLLENKVLFTDSYKKDFTNSPYKSLIDEDEKILFLE